MIKLIYKIFIKGFLALLPLAITVFLLTWLLKGFESVLGKILFYTLPSGWYYPGMGVVAGFILIFFSGLLLHIWFIRKIVSWMESLLHRLPIINEIYGAVMQLVEYFKGTQKSVVGKTVMVKVANSSIRLLGLVTREEFHDAPKGLGNDDTVAVFFPMSYQIGGFTAYVRRSDTEPIEMSAKDAFRWALTAGVSTKRSEIDNNSL